MEKRDIDILTLLVSRLAELTAEDDLAEAVEGAMAELSGDTAELKAALYRLGGMILQMDERNKDALRSRRIAQLTAEQRAEFETVERIIDKNLLNYHFQPIIDTVSGEIFAYEALMRSADDPSITPLHILKYAELNGRLDDVEKATFLNVLNIIGEKKPQLCGRSVFINSIPNAVLGHEDAEQVFELLRRNADVAVVELTESTEADEAQLKMLQSRYSSMNVKIAVDDYGTGYSNVQNLLRYMPNYVKIDRSLVSEINSDSKKRHLVRDIIEFCHDNGILALAEGVETSAELKTVMLMGADLIQGYYTARPAPELIDSIDYDIKKEIIDYHHQRLDGKESRVYKADSTERVILDRLKDHGYTCIRITPSEDHGDITIVGESSLETDIHIEIDQGFVGRVTLDKVHLSNDKNRPCIQLAKHSRVELAIAGDCVLSKGGIYVPEGSEIEFTGDGTMTINTATSYFYCIGAPMDQRHGRLIFNADAEFYLSANGDIGTYIGSGLGGEIDIRHGVYSLSGTINIGVGIGTLTGNVDMRVQKCNVEANISLAKGAAIGSCEGDVMVTMSEITLNTTLRGRETACVGSVGGNACISFENANYTVTAGSQAMTMLGSLYKKSDIFIRNISMNIDAAGQDAYIFGGLDGRTKLNMASTDTQIKLVSRFDHFLSHKDSDIKLGSGRYRVFVNNENVNIEPNI